MGCTLEILHPSQQHTQTIVAAVHTHISTHLIHVVVTDVHEKTSNTGILF